MSKTPWTDKEINEAKAKARLLALGESVTPKERVATLLREVEQKLKAPPNRESALEIVVLSISALVHHGRYGGLQSARINELKELVSGLLQLWDVHPTGRSAGSAFYTELYTSLSAVAKRDGNHWGAAWRQIFALEYSGQASRSDQPHYHLLSAQRLARLGLLENAVGQLNAFFLSVSDASHPSKPTALIMMGRTLRLCGRLEQAESSISQAIKEITQSVAAGDEENDLLIEALWEKTCIGVARTGNLHDLIAATRSRGTHKSVGYLTEASIWAKTVADRRFMERTRSMKQVEKESSSATRALGEFHKAALAFDDAYDLSLPLVNRVSKVCGLLENRAQLQSIEKEFLVLAAAIRFFHRFKAKTLLELATSEYRSLAIRASGGGCIEPLGVLRDLVADEVEPKANVAA